MACDLRSRHNQEVLGLLVITNRISHIGGADSHNQYAQNIRACRAVNMSSKWCCVLAVVCLSAILLSLDADAQPTTDDITSCSASSLDEVVNMVKTIASNQQQKIEQISDELTGVKSCLLYTSPSPRDRTRSRMPSSA